MVKLDLFLQDYLEILLRILLEFVKKSILNSFSQTNKCTKIECLF